MYMNLKPNKHKRISFNTMTMALLGFISPPPPPPKILGPSIKFSSAPNLIFCSGPPLNYFGLEFLVPTPIIRGGGGVATM